MQNLGNKCLDFWKQLPSYLLQGIEIKQLSMGGAAKHLQTEEDKSSSQNFTEEIPQDSDHLQKFTHYQEQKNSRNGSDLPIISMTTAT